MCIDRHLKIFKNCLFCDSVKKFILLFIYNRHLKRFVNF